jgi:hypothetical protein
MSNSGAKRLRNRYVAGRTEENHGTDVFFFFFFFFRCYNFIA